jgi:hypothetical protein
MKITVCELPDGGKEFPDAWTRLGEHVRASGSELVLLPDMPFAPWFAGAQHFDSGVWQQAVKAHEAWEMRLNELGAKYVCSSRPVYFGNERWDEGFVWDAGLGLRSVHAKSEFRHEKGAWETAWYRSTFPSFTPLELDGFHIALLMGAELKLDDEVRLYGAEHVDVIAIPRGANQVAFDSWQQRACDLAREANAHVIASTRSGVFGGQGCIVSRQGEVLGVTSGAEPFITRDLEWAVAHGTPLQASELAGELDPLVTGVPPH